MFSDGLSRNAILIAIGVVVITVVFGTVLATEHTVQILGFGTFICVSLFALLNQVVSNEATATKLDKAEDKIDVVTDKIDETKKTSETIKTLVNSAMSSQMKISMIALRRVAELTGHPDDQAAADLAKKLFDGHEKGQADVDADAGKIGMLQDSDPILVSIVPNKDEPLPVREHPKKE